MTLLLVQLSSSFVHNGAARLAQRASQTQSKLHFSTSQLIAVGDFADEIEKATGTEIYSPIFKAGLFIFGSGIVSAFVAGFIVSQSNSWEDLELEFQAGKTKQLIPEADMKQRANQSPSGGETPEVADASEPTQGQLKEEDEADEKEFSGLDL